MAARPRIANDPRWELPAGWTIAALEPDNPKPLRYYAHYTTWPNIWREKLLQRYSG